MNLSLDVFEGAEEDVSSLEDVSYLAESINENGANPGELNLLMDSYLDGIEDIVKKSILVFFSDEESYCGDEFEEDIICSPYYIDLVIETSVLNGVDKAYEMINNSDDVCSDDEISGDIKKLIEIREKCGSKNIPKQFSAGITLMYLELCEGMTLPDSASKILYNE